MRAFLVCRPGRTKGLPRERKICTSREANTDNEIYHDLNVKESTNNNVDHDSSNNNTTTHNTNTHNTNTPY